MVATKDSPGAAIALGTCALAAESGKINNESTSAGSGKAFIGVASFMRHANFGNAKMTPACRLRVHRLVDAGQRAEKHRAQTGIDRLASYRVRWSRRRSSVMRWHLPCLHANALLRDGGRVCG
jgi:hypothetical protein